MRFFIIYILLFSFKSIYSQNKKNEISIILSEHLTFSQLNNKSDSRFKSPPSFSDFINFGIRFDKKILKENLGIKFNTCISTLELSSNVKYKIVENKRSSSGISSSTNTFTYWQIGISKDLNIEDKIKFNIEMGFRTLFSSPLSSGKISGSSNTLDSFYSYDFNFIKQKKMAFVPYFGFGLNIPIKKMKLGLQFWAQKGFSNILIYNYKFNYGSYAFQSSVYSKGNAIGINLFLRVITF